MKKIFLGIITVLTLTLFVGCTKETEIKPDEEITNPIGTIKCINTLDELMSDDYEPKFEINNDEYIDGEFPYINMDFAEADEINNLMKAYALFDQAEKLSVDKSREVAGQTIYLDYAETKPSVSIYDDRYLFINIEADEQRYNLSTSLCIDLEEQKILTKEEILKLANYDLASNMTSVLDELTEKYNVPSFDYYGINDKDKFYNDLSKEINDSIKDNDFYIYGTKFDNTLDLSKYGEVKIDDLYQEGKYFEMRSYFTSFNNMNENTLKVYPTYTNEDGFILMIENQNTEDTMYKEIIKLN